jgi:polysaccharide export outer membrane protein
VRGPANGSCRRVTCCLLVAFLAVGAAAAQVPEAAPEGEYVIGVEDKLSISVWREPDLTRTVTVRPDGKITFPLIGDIQAAGKSAQSLDEVITAQIARYIKEPVVTVTVEEINNFKVYVLGEVTKQEALLLRQRTRLLQALAIAGGLTQYADKSNVVLVREEGGREVRMRVDYRKLVSGERPELNHWLKPGDTIIVN